ncbi:hypothetical protein NP308_21985, partial [Salmonella enterica]|nr:hypothetical protein [Salmonella enterica]
SLKTSIKTITYLSDIGCLEIQGASLKPLFTSENLFGLRNLADGWRYTATSRRCGDYLRPDQHRRPELRQE